MHDQSCDVPWGMASSLPRAAEYMVAEPMEGS